MAETEADANVRRAAERVMAGRAPAELIRDMEKRERTTTATGPPLDFLTPPPCKHEWRQYMEILDGPEVRDEMKQPFPDFRISNLYPDGFFCIHCTERKAE